jgi:hypothetical protein
VLDAGSRDGGARRIEGGAAPPMDATDAAAQTNLEYDVAGHRIHLEATPDACYVVDQVEGGLLRKKLSLDPPCYLVLRQAHPAAAATGGSARSARGKPVGDVGQPLAWRYRDKGDVVVFAAIGGPTPPSVWHGRDSSQTTFHCGGRSQGVLIQGSKIWLSRALADGFTCAEVGMDEPMFWIWAHDDRCSPQLPCAEP